MKNLFVAYSPYNIILCCGLANTTYKAFENDLIIINQFNIKNLDIEYIKSNFKNAYIIQDLYMYENRKHINPVIKKLSYVASNIEMLKKINNIIKGIGYSNLFISHDNSPRDQRLIDFFSNSNSHITFIEDGAVCYNSHEKFNNKSGKKLLYKYVYGVKNSYETIEILGTHSKIDDYMLVYPKLAREELRNKKIIEITKESILEGIRIAYKKYIESVRVDDSSVFILLEHSESPVIRIDEYVDILKKVIYILHKLNYSIYVKYHPRETKKYLQDITDSYSIKVLSNDIPSEVFLYSSQSKNVQVVSVKTTSIYIFKKILHDCNIVSLIKMLNIDDEGIEKMYHNLMIKMPMNLEEFNEIITN
jgi:hypothetical protein